MDKSFFLEDISVIIPTFNRAEELKKTLKSLEKFSKQIREIIVVDQTKDDSTKKVVMTSKMKNIKYVFSKIPSITIARNLGVKKTSEKTKIICFIDDDVSVLPSYFPNILYIFNNYKEAKAAAGYVPYEKSMPQPSKFEQLARKIFYLGGRIYPDDAKIVSAYGNRYPLKIYKIINADWMPGDNMCYKKELFKDMKFDENLLGYTVAEDIDFGYRISKKYKNSIFITPYAKIIHRYSFKERMPTAKISYINQIDHFYFNFKNMNKTFKEKIIFMWSIMGIIFMRTLLFFAAPNKKNAMKTKFFFSSLFYTIFNIMKIKRGELESLKVY